MEPNEANEAPTTVSVWKKQTGPQIIDVPSGNKARVRRISLDVVIKTGRLPNILMPIVQQSMATGGKVPAGDIKPEQIPAFMQMIDTVVIMACAEPKVYDTPREDQDRDEEKLYVDEVDFADKMAVYSFAVGGAAELESFRDEPAGDVEPVRDVEDVAVPS